MESSSSEMMKEARESVVRWIDQKPSKAVEESSTFAKGIVGENPQFQRTEPWTPYYGIPVEIMKLNNDLTFTESAQSAAQNPISNQNIDDMPTQIARFLAALTRFMENRATLFMLPHTFVVGKWFFKNTTNFDAIIKLTGTDIRTFDRILIENGDDQWIVINTGSSSMNGAPRAFLLTVAEVTTIDESIKENVGQFLTRLVTSYDSNYLKATQASRDSDNLQFQFQTFDFNMKNIIPAPNAWRIIQTRLEFDLDKHKHLMFNAFLLCINPYSFDKAWLLATKISVQDRDVFPFLDPRSLIVDCMDAQIYTGNIKTDWSISFHKDIGGLAHAPQLWSLPIRKVLPFRSLLASTSIPPLSLKHLTNQWKTMNKKSESLQAIVNDIESQQQIVPHCAPFAQQPTPAAFGFDQMSAKTIEEVCIDDLEPELGQFDGLFNEIDKEEDNITLISQISPQELLPTDAEIQKQDDEDEAWAFQFESELEDDEVEVIAIERNDQEFMGSMFPPTVAVLEPTPIFNPNLHKDRWDQHTRDSEVALTIPSISVGAEFSLSILYTVDCGPLTNADFQSLFHDMPYVEPFIRDYMREFGESTSQHTAAGKILHHPLNDKEHWADIVLKLMEHRKISSGSIQDEHGFRGSNDIPQSTQIEVHTTKGIDTSSGSQPSIGELLHADLIGRWFGNTIFSPVVNREVGMTIVSDTRAGLSARFNMPMFPLMRRIPPSSMRVPIFGESMIGSPPQLHNKPQGFQGPIPMLSASFHPSIAALIDPCVASGWVVEAQITHRFLENGMSGQQAYDFYGMDISNIDPDQKSTTLHCLTVIKHYCAVVCLVSSCLRLRVLCDKLDLPNYPTIHDVLRMTQLFWPNNAISRLGKHRNHGDLAKNLTIVYDIVTTSMSESTERLTVNLKDPNLMIVLTNIMTESQAVVWTDGRQQVSMKLYAAITDMIQDFHFRVGKRPNHVSLWQSMFNANLLPKVLAKQHSLKSTTSMTNLPNGRELLEMNGAIEWFMKSRHTRGKKQPKREDVKSWRSQFDQKQDTIPSINDFALNGAYLHQSASEGFHVTEENKGYLFARKQLLLANENLTTRTHILQNILGWNGHAYLGTPNQNRLLGKLLWIGSYDIPHLPRIIQTSELRSRWQFSYDTIIACEPFVQRNISGEYLFGVSFGPPTTESVEASQCSAPSKGILIRDPSVFYQARQNILVDNLLSLESMKIIDHTQLVFADSLAEQLIHGSVRLNPEVAKQIRFIASNREIIYKRVNKLYDIGMPLSNILKSEISDMWTGPNYDPKRLAPEFHLGWVRNAVYISVVKTARWLAAVTKSIVVLIKSVPTSQHYHNIILFDTLQKDLRKIKRILAPTRMDEPEESIKMMLGVFSVILEISTSISTIFKSYYLSLVPWSMFLGELTPKSDVRNVKDVFTTTNVVHRNSMIVFGNNFDVTNEMERVISDIPKTEYASENIKSLQKLMDGPNSPEWFSRTNSASVIVYQPIRNKRMDVSWLGDVRVVGILKVDNWSHLPDHTLRYKHHRDQSDLFRTERLQLWRSSLGVAATTNSNRNMFREIVLDVAKNNAWKMLWDDSPSLFKANLDRGQQIMRYLRIKRAILMKKSTKADTESIINSIVLEAVNVAIRSWRGWRMEEPKTGHTASTLGSEKFQFFYSQIKRIREFLLETSQPPFQRVLIARDFVYNCISMSPILGVYGSNVMIGIEVCSPHTVQDDPKWIVKVTQEHTSVGQTFIRADSAFIRPTPNSSPKVLGAHPRTRSIGDRWCKEPLTALSAGELVEPLEMESKMSLAAWEPPADPRVVEGASRVASQFFPIVDVVTTQRTISMHPNLHALVVAPSVFWKHVPMSHVETLFLRTISPTSGEKFSKEDKYAIGIILDHLEVSAKQYEKSAKKMQLLLHVIWILAKMQLTNSIVDIAKVAVIALISRVHQKGAGNVIDEAKKLAHEKIDRLYKVELDDLNEKFPLAGFGIHKGYYLDAQKMIQEVQESAKSKLDRLKSMIDAIVPNNIWPLEEEWRYFKSVVEIWNTPLTSAVGEELAQKLSHMEEPEIDSFLNEKMVADADDILLRRFKDEVRYSEQKEAVNDVMKGALRSMALYTLSSKTWTTPIHFTPGAFVVDACKEAKRDMGTYRIPKNVPSLCEDPSLVEKWFNEEMTSVHKKWTEASVIFTEQIGRHYNPVANIYAPTAYTTLLPVNPQIQDKETPNIKEVLSGFKSWMTEEGPWNVEKAIQTADLLWNITAIIRRAYRIYLPDIEKRTKQINPKDLPEKLAEMYARLRSHTDGSEEGEVHKPPISVLWIGV